MPGLNDQIKDLFQQSALKGNDLKKALRDLVRETWPDMPPWTTLDAPVIEEVQKATVGSGVVLTYREDGVQKVVLAETGDHYRKPGDPASYMIPGGFINLSRTPGSALVPASEAPEDGRTGAAREVEEELKNADGSPLLEVAPERLKPMDTKTLLFRSGERRIVLGFMLELTPEEVQTVKAHVARLEAEPAYREATAQQSMNHESGKAEVGSVAIVTLDDVAAGKSNLFHKDQQSLFREVQAHYASIATAAKAQAPSPGIK